MIVLPNMGLVKWDSINDAFSHEQLAANFTALDNHNHTAGKGVKIPYGGLEDQSVSVANLRTDVLERFATPSPVAIATVFSYLGAEKVAGSRTFPLAGAELSSSPTIELAKTTFYLRGGKKYRAQMIFGTGSTAPGGKFVLEIGRMTGISTGSWELPGLFTAEAQKILETGTLSVANQKTEQEAEFEVTTSGFYVPVMRTTVKTAASSSVGIGLSFSAAGS